MLSLSYFPLCSSLVILDRGQSTDLIKEYCPAWCCNIWDHPSFLLLTSVLIGTTRVWVSELSTLLAVFPSKHCHFNASKVMCLVHKALRWSLKTQALKKTVIFFLLFLFLGHWRLVLWSFVFKNKKAGYLIPAALRRCFYCLSLRDSSVEICIHPCMCLLARLHLPPLALAAAGGEGCLAACESRVCVSSPFLEEIQPLCTGVVRHPGLHQGTKPLLGSSVTSW